MPQIFNIVKCFKCSIYQVDIQKKSTNKWTCKVCNSKQSLKQVLFRHSTRYYAQCYTFKLKVFYQGEAKECRLRVQNLNKIRNEVKNEIDMNLIKEGENFSKNFQLFPPSVREEQEEEKENDAGTSSSNNKKNQVVVKTSKWAKYLTTSDDNEDQ